MLSGNKQVYAEAYQRALAGKPHRSLWNFVTSRFEDEYTRQSRETGSRDGSAARAQAEAVREANTHSI